LLRWVGWRSRSGDEPKGGRRGLPRFAIRVSALPSDSAFVSEKRLGRGLGLLSVVLELPLIGQLFFFGDVFDWGWLFFLGLGIAPLAALVGLGISAGRRDYWGISASCLGLGAVAVPTLVIWAAVSALGSGG
jgi:hypothetical protein